MSELIKKEVMVPKELNEVLECLKVIVKAIKSGVSIGEITAKALPSFITAVEGVQGIPLEIKEYLKGSVDAGLLFGNDVVFTFLDNEVKEVDAAPAE